MPARIAVITDSSACLPDLVAARWAVGVVQIQMNLHNHMDDENRFDRAEVIDARRKFPLFRDRRPDSYTAITSTTEL